MILEEVRWMMTGFRCPFDDKHEHEREEAIFLTSLSNIRMHADRCKIDVTPEVDTFTNP